MRDIYHLSLILTLGIFMFSCSHKENEPDVAITSISISPSSTSIIVGEMVQLTVEVRPESSSVKSIVWGSSNEAVATVSNTGLVTAISNGSSLITATIKGKSALCNVTVTDFVHFEDNNFKAYCLANFDTDRDGEISFTEASAVKKLWLSDRKISSLKGLESFVNLTDLAFYNCQLTSLDVSNNTALTFLWCDKNQLTSLDVSNNTALTSLRCYGNRLTSLDVSNNTALTELYCYNNQLTSLDVSNNTALTYLYCSDNQLTSLDVSNNTALVYLNCYNNQLTSLDVSKNTALRFLDCRNNSFLKYIYLSTGQSIADFLYDSPVTIIYK